MGIPGPRDLYNRLERLVTPLANQVTRTEEFAQAVALLSTLNRSVRGETDKLQARLWHLVNLPAGTDVLRLKQQVGSLDRELRLLSLELQRARKEASRRGVPRPEHD